MSEGWIAVHLLFLSIEDLWEQQLFMPVILELGVVGLIRILRIGGTPALLPGLFMLAAGYVTRESVGYGDGWLVLALGMWINDVGLWQMIFTGSVLALFFGVCLRKREVPFVPFLAAAYVIGEWL